MLYDIALAGKTALVNKQRYLRLVGYSSAHIR
jgi:hypothetical protein